MLYLIITLLVIISIAINISEAFHQIDILSEKGIAKVNKANYDRLSIKQIRVSNPAKGPHKEKTVKVGSKRPQTMGLLGYTLDDRIEISGVKGRREIVIMRVTPRDDKELKQLIQIVEDYNKIG